MKYLWLFLFLAGVAQADEIQCLDEAVAGMAFGDSSALKKITGNSYFINKEADIPYTTFSNQSQTETISLFFHPGTTKGVFSEIKISLAGKIKRSDKEKKQLLQIPHFVTQKGILLGMKQEQVLLILGSRGLVSKTKDVLFYKITGSEVPSKYNMPEYFGRYTFKKNLLVEAHFGFSLP